MDVHVCLLVKFMEEKCNNITNEILCQKELKTIFVNILTP